MLKENKSMKNFLVLWFGQFVSLIGSGISSFGLSIWILQNTQTTTSFALTFLFRLLPGIIFAPIAGSFVDRHDRKLTMMITDSLDMVVKLLLLASVLTGGLSLKIIYPMLFVSATLSAFQGPALQTSIPLIVNKKDLPRANGLMQLIQSIETVICPLIAGSLYMVIGLSGLFIVDFITYIIAILTVLPQHIKFEKAQDNTSKGLTRVWEDFKMAYTFLKTKKGFFILIISFSILNFFANFCFVLLGPMIIELENSSIYGLVTSVSGMGMVVGGLFAGILPAKNNKIKKIVCSLLLCSVGLVFMGWTPLWYIIAFGFFLFMLPVPYANGTLGAFLQTKIEPNLLGRVGGLLNLILRVTSPVAIILSGVLADYIFTPLMVDNGVLANTFVAGILGTGNTRGIGLMFVVSGICLAFTCLYLLLNRSVMTLEERISDVEQN